MIVSTVTGWPLTCPFTAVVDVDAVSEEVVTVTVVAGTTLTVVRAQDGSAGVSHAAGAAVRHMVTARDLREPQQHMDASTTVHGLDDSSSVVGTAKTQTLTNKTMSGADNTFTAIPQASVVGLTALIPPGVTWEFSGSTAPTGWLLEDGTAYSRATYAALFTAIGTTYGAGDGTTTFNVPDHRERATVGLDASRTAFNTLGKTGGEVDHMLTVAEMPAHTHGITARSLATAFGDWALGWVTQTGNAANPNTISTGGNSSHNNLQPYIVKNFIIKT
jgi:microcystin-dependent protein